MLDKEDEVPIIINLHSGFDGGFANRLANEWRTELLKSGPV